MSNELGLTNSNNIWWDGAKYINSWSDCKGRSCRPKLIQLRNSFDILKATNLKAPHDGILAKLFDNNNTGKWMEETWKWFTE